MAGGWICNRLSDSICPVKDFCLARLQLTRVGGRLLVSPFAPFYSL